jgi:hypothetical protein
MTASGQANCQFQYCPEVQAGLASVIPPLSTEPQRYLISSSDKTGQRTKAQLTLTEHGAPNTNRCCLICKLGKRMSLRGERVKWTARYSPCLTSLIRYPQLPTSLVRLKKSADSSEYDVRNFARHSRF